MTLPRHRLVLWLAGLLLAGGGLLTVWLIAGRGPQPLADHELVELRRAVQAGELAKAEPLLARGLATEPDHPDVLLAAGDVAVLREQPAKAIPYYERALERPDVDLDRTRFSLAEAQRTLGQLSAAERNLREIKDQKTYPVAERIAFVFTTSGRRRSALPWLQELIGTGRSHLGTLLVITDPERPALDAEFLKTCQTIAPDDPLTHLASAVEAASRNDWDGVAKWIAGAGEFPESQALRGELLLARNQLAEFAEWQQTVSRETEVLPEIWVLRGRWAEAMGQAKSAVRCFFEATRRDINARSAVYRLGKELHALDENSLAGPFLKRANELHELSAAIEQLHRKPGDLEVIRLLAEQTERLGRLWESAAWCRVAEEQNPLEPWVRSLAAKLQPRITSETPWTVLDPDPRIGFPVDRFPLPDWSASTPATQAIAAQPPSGIRFTNAAARLGIDFTYFNSPDPATEGMRIFESAGGGIAALDYDGDDWPDLYFTQGCPWPVQPDRRSPLDRLFRNLRGTSSQDVTQQAGLHEDGFGQGVTAGDFDNDGFADLYVANIGRNRLYRNNGDGTFADVTGQMAALDDTWTASVAMADLTGDGLPDLYDVTYLAGDDVHTRICDRNGHRRVCDPGSFAAAADRCFVNLGDGRFERLDGPSAGLAAPEGKGLGVVIADLAGSPALDVFVANDAVANHTFVNLTTDPSRPRFAESALAMGLAFDADGRPQACMGVAAGDADGDARLDLFVTNYIRESNTLYRQIGDGMFADETRAAGLRDPGFAWLGFGVQFLDADLDGHPDLLVANGHLDDFSYDNQPLEMPTQVLRNTGRGKFVELPAKELGPYFEKQHIGRSVATLDWNRDGRADAAVGAFDEPSALLLNESAAGNFVALSLVGTASARAPIGARVIAEIGDERRVLQLTAGDGYQASNEKRLILGLGAATQIDRLTVRWAGGQEEELGAVAAGRSYRVIEERGVVEIRRE